MNESDHEEPQRSEAENGRAGNPFEDARTEDPLKALDAGSDSVNHHAPGGAVDRSPDVADPSLTGETPFVAKLVVDDGEQESGAVTTGDAFEDEDDTKIRVGSPFREDSPILTSGRVVRPSGEAAYAEFGPFLYTSMGASAAAVVVLFFAAAGFWWFPAGGAIVTLLGAVLSIVGLFSTKRYRISAIATLPMHVTLFFLCYVRSLG